MTQKLIGLKKGKSILKRMNKKKSRINPLKKISTIYKKIRTTLKKKKGKKKKGKSKYEVTYQMGGRGSKKKSNKKIRCGNLNRKKKGYTLKRAERKCLKNKDCNFSWQMAMKEYPKPCHPKKKYWKKQGVTWKTLGVH